MKKIFTLLTILAIGATAQAQLFSQNFNSSSTLADFIDATTPGSTKFNSLSTSGAGTVVSINSSKLRYVRTGNAGNFSRTTDFSTVPTFMKYAFEFTMSGNSAAQTTAITFQLGDGFTTSNSTEANASVHSRFAINTTTVAGEFQLRNIGGSVNSSNLAGAQNIVWIINNSGGSKNYTAPDATTESVADDTYDLWAGTTKIFNDIAATTAAKTLADIKMVWSAGSATIDFDNFEITDLDAPLPISLVKFTADKVAEKVKVQWATATEINNEKFIVERSSNGREYEVISEIAGAGNSKEINNYSILDHAPLKGTSYYRLSQKDFDGTTESFAPVAVSMDSKNIEIIKASSDANTINLNIFSPNAMETSILVRDLSGRTIAEQKINLLEGYQNINLNSKNYSSGIHLIQIVNGENAVVKKLVL